MDATGDGDLAARAGASVKVGRNSDGLCQPMTMNFTIDNVDSKRLYREIHEHPENYNIHDPSGNGTESVFLERGKFYQIPLRALISRDFDNLLVCGRCISATHEAIAALRVTPISMATGQAAGAASAVVAKTGVPAREIDPKEVIRRLQKQKVILE